VEDNSSMAFRTKFLRSTHQVLPQKCWTNSQKFLCWLWFARNPTQNFM